MIMRRIKKRKKEKTMATHVKKRFYDRWSIILTDELHKSFVKMINTGNSMCVDKQSKRISIHEITYKDAVLTVVYDKCRKMLVTVLPRDAVYDDRLQTWDMMGDSYLLGDL
jgi:hypothetical protein